MALRYHHHTTLIFCDVDNEVPQLSQTYIESFDQGIMDMNRNGNSANFFLYVCNGKKVEELFASTLNGIAASVKHVFSIIVVLNA